MLLWCAVLWYRCHGNHVVHDTLYLIVGTFELFTIQHDIELVLRFSILCAPLFVFDKDTDGLCSFLQFLRYKGEGNGFPLKTRDWSSGILKKVNGYEADKIFFLDMPVIPQEFVDWHCGANWFEHDLRRSISE